MNNTTFFMENPEPRFLNCPTIQRTVSNYSELSSLAGVTLPQHRGLLAGATSEKVMKPQEGELVSEISKLQCMVSELKTGFSSALLELSQIQHGDSHLREELEENRRNCQKKALRLEALVETLRAELGVMQSHVLQLYRDKPQPEDRGPVSKQRDGDPGEAGAGRGQCVCCSGVSSPRGKVLLHCYLQGLKAGLCEGTDARHQVAMQLLHSEWEYVSTLNQLYDKYKTPPAHQMTMEPYQTYLKFVEEMLQRHLHFRNTLQERLSAEHWKSLVGDIIVQLIGQNDTSFTDMYLGYTTTLATFLSMEFNRINLPDKSHKIQVCHIEKEELKLLSLLLAPVSRIHSYLSHIQNLLQWTGKDHPDCSLLLGTEKILRSTLSRCHAILEEDVRWDNRDGAGQSGSGAPLACSSANCCSRTQTCQTRESRPLRSDAGTTTQREDLQAVSSGCRAMHLECWSCSPVRRRSCGRDQGAHIQSQSGQDCGHAHHGDLFSLRPPDTPGWGENSDSGQGTSSQPTGKGSNDHQGPQTNHSLDDCETDPDDTSAFDYSSVTSCSPDGTLGRVGSHEEEDEEEEDSQVPVLLKPVYKQRDSPRERTVCLRWQIPRLTPHPPIRKPPGPCGLGSTPCLVGSYGKRLVSIRKGSPPLHPKSAFRPIWDDPTKQGDNSTPEKDRQGFVPIQAPGRQAFQAFNPSRDNNLRPGMTLQRGTHVGSGGLWDESEDSEGPCSTV